MAPPDFGGSVNRGWGDRLCPPNNTCTPGFLDLPTALNHIWQQHAVNINVRPLTEFSSKRFELSNFLQELSKVYYANVTLKTQYSMGISPFTEVAT